ncbi:MAG: NAD-dependent epimerase/dehydratase family protein [Candidatus Thiodiazotropha sp.]
MKIVITGSAGLIGQHIQYRLFSKADFECQIIGITHELFNDKDHLTEILEHTDVLIHCAGINRDSDEELETGNKLLAKNLVNALLKSSATPHLFYTNSIHTDSNTAYGRGKQLAHDIFTAWAEDNSANYTELVLPHIFGEGGRPFYNSVVHTFCYQLTKSEPLKIDSGGQLELIHAQAIPIAIIDAIHKRHHGQLRLIGKRISVAEVAGKLISMHREYTSGIVPDLRNHFELDLFNTLRSYMYPDFYPRLLDLHTDERGSLFEAIKNLNGGQVFLSTTKPGITRGNHYHLHKVERFLVVRGSAIIRIRRLFEESVLEFNVCGDTPCYIDMPTFHTHSITNTGTDELLTLFWSHEIFDPNDSDTFYEPVLSHT